MFQCLISCPAQLTDDSAPVGENEWYPYTAYSPLPDVGPGLFCFLQRGGTHKINT